MKVKRITIEIKGLDEALKEAGRTYEKVSRGEQVGEKTGLYFGSLKDMRRVLTERRVELLKTIKEREPSSVYELAKMLRRDLKNVLQDISYLEELGLVEITETKDRKIPRVSYDKINFEVAL
ncbi:MAG: ArsR family transcriptional regulator [Nitrospirota bacterium]